MLQSLMIDSNVCSFCREVQLAQRGEGLCFDQTDTLIVLPTLGCFVRGYSLIVPKAHITSMAAQSRNELFESEALLEVTRKVSEELFGPTIVAEHGTGAPEEPTAACCDHAHLHLIPTRRFNEVLDFYRGRGGPERVLGSLDELAEYEGQSYLTLSEEPGRWRIWVGASRFPRQCIRRATAGAEGMDAMFDWKLHPCEANMAETATLNRYARKRGQGA